ncbi:hypothetical protein ACFL34_04155 [Candidatus Sumerlaeota bacterium]
MQLVAGDPTAADQLSPEELCRQLYEATIASYRQLSFVAVHKLYKELPARIAADIGAMLQEQLEPHVQQTMQWAKSLQELASEREVAILREAVRLGETRRALGLIQQRMAAVKTSDGKSRNAAIVGSILGSLINDQDKVVGIVKALSRNPKAYGLTDEHVQALKQGIERRMASVYQEGSETLERQFSAARNSLIVELRNQLPGKIATSDQITAASVEKFQAVLRALVGTAVASQSTGRWRDLLGLLIELCPQRLSTAGAQAGIEQRLYMVVTPLERRVIDKCMYEVGQLPVVAAGLLQFAKTVEPSEQKTIDWLIEVMGMLRNEQFQAFILQKMELAAQLRIAGVEALGNLGGERAVKQLCGILTSSIKQAGGKKMLTEGPHRRMALLTISSLAKIAGSRRTEAPLRNRILELVRSALPAGDARVSLIAALAFFRRPGAGWSADHQRWAVETLGHGLWLSDDTPLFASGDEHQRTILGVREPIADALGQLAPRCSGVFIQVVKDHLSEPGAAFMACADIAQQTGDVVFVPLLEEMVVAAMKGRARGKYEEETYYDPTTRTRKTMSSDQIVGDLVFALDKIGGEPGEEALARLFEAFKSGRLTSPGGETMNILLDARQRWSRRTGQEMFTGDAATTRTVAALPPEQVKALLKQLSGGLLMTGKKRARIINAIRELAEAFTVEAVDPLLDLLLTREEMIANAAKTALLRFGDIDAPKAASQSLCMSVIERLESPKRAVVDAAQDLLAELGPEREPFRTALLKITDAEPDGRLATAVRTVLERAAIPHADQGAAGDQAPVIDPVLAADQNGAAATTAATTGEDENQAAGTDKKGPPVAAVSQMDLRREYFLARREWIKGGKKGTPPEPPAGAA